MSELFVHPMIVLPTSLNKSVTPSWSEASKFELPKVSLLILQVNRATTARYYKNTHSTLITPHTIMLSQMHSYICICAVAYSFTLHSFYWHVLYVGSESSLNAIEVTIELNNSQCHHWPQVQTQYHWKFIPCHILLRYCLTLGILFSYVTDYVIRS